MILLCSFFTQKDSSQSYHDCIGVLLSISAASCSSFHWEHFKNPFTFGSFSQRGRYESKKQNVILLRLRRVIKVPKGVWVYAASFWLKIWTKPYIPLVASILLKEISQQCLEIRTSLSPQAQVRTQRSDRDTGDACPTARRNVHSQAGRVFHQRGQGGGVLSNFWNNESKCVFKERTIKVCGSYVLDAVLRCGTPDGVLDSL